MQPSEFGLVHGFEVGEHKIQIAHIDILERVVLKYIPVYEAWELIHDSLLLDKR
jgi:hypothetical protein